MNSEMLVLYHRILCNDTIQFGIAYRENREPPSEWQMERVDLRTFEMSIHTYQTTSCHDQENSNAT